MAMLEIRLQAKGQPLIARVNMPVCPSTGDIVTLRTKWSEKEALNYIVMQVRHELTDQYQDKPSDTVVSYVVTKILVGQGMPV